MKDTEKSKPATDKQIELLRKHGPIIDAGLSCAEASALIGQLPQLKRVDYSKFHLEKYKGKSTRYECPSCGKSNEFTRFIDSNGNHIADNVGICNRKNNCGHTYTPAQYFSDCPEEKAKWADDTPQVQLTWRERARRNAVKVFALSPRIKAAKQEPTLEEIETENGWRRWWDNAKALPNTKGGGYLEGRNLSVDLAMAAGVRFSMEWYGRPAVLFPIHNRGGELIAVSCRYIDGRIEVDPATGKTEEVFPNGAKKKTLNGGPNNLGVFYATPDALKADCVAITEGPFDALALASVGIAAIALIGKSWPEWLASALAFKNVLIATDNDKAGEDIAVKCETILSERGAHCLRFKTSKAKDWGEWAERYGNGSKQRDILRAFGSLCDDDHRIWAAYELANKGLLDRALFLVRLIDIEWRTAIEKKLRTIALNSV